MSTRRIIMPLIALAFLASNSISVHSQIPSTTRSERPLNDSTLEARARDLFRDLRCMVCEGQSLDESDAPLARDLRFIIRKHIQDGKSNQDILDFATARYGDSIHLRPPLQGRTLGLWIAPTIILLAGLTGLIIRWRKRSTHQTSTTQ